MADSKISQLPIGTLSVDTIFPIVSNGTTSQTNLFTISDYMIPLIPSGATGETGLQGAAGAKGEPGIQGAAGVVGPAGLSWSGSWNTDTTYLLNDAVGYSGASYFCYSAITTSGNTSPVDDTSHWALLASQGATGPQGPAGVSGQTGPQGPAGNSVTPTIGVYTATISAPYTQLSSTINKVIATQNISTERVTLPSGTAVIGDKVTVININNINNEPYAFFVRASAGGSALYRDGLSNASISEFAIYPNQQIEFTFIGTNSWMCEPIKSRELLECIGTIYQTGTEDPSITNVFYDTLSVGEEWTMDNYRSISFTRENVGEYTIWVKWKHMNTNGNKIAVMFGDGKCVTNGYKYTGDLGGGLNYTSFGFKTYTPAGVLSDGLLNGSNGGSFSVKLYQ